VGTQSERFRKVTLTAADLERLTVFDAERSFDGDGRLLRLGLQANALGIAYEFDPDCFWLYVVTDCDNAPRLQEPIRDPARLDWNEVTKVAHYYLAVNAMTKPMQVREDSPPYGGNRP
jgi:hypothetical protein